MQHMSPAINLYFLYRSKKLWLHYLCTFSLTPNKSSIQLTDEQILSDYNSDKIVEGVVMRIYCILICRLLFVTLKCVLPVYKRCEDELSAQHLTALLMRVSKFLSTLNSAPFTFNVNTTQLQHTFGRFSSFIYQAEWFSFIDIAQSYFLNISKFIISIIPEVLLLSNLDSLRCPNVS